jgi:hypothetical protein
MGIGSGNKQLKFNRVIHPSALRTSGKTHIRIVRIYIPAMFAPKNPIIARPWLEAPAAKFRINPYRRKPRQQDDHIRQNQIGYRHAQEFRSLAPLMGQ